MDWENYEKFVEQVYRELGETQGIKVFSKREYLATTGMSIEIDLSFELEALGSRIFGIVECKHYKRRIEAMRVLAFAKTIELLQAHKGIIVSTKGFQKGAVTVAEREGIALALLDTNKPLEYVVRRDPETATVALQGCLYLGSKFASGHDSTSGLPFKSASQMVNLLRRYRKPTQSGRL